jgi:pimeloyl-ACP methyl ester carboxylesterase
VALAFAGAHPDRLSSLALFEPASIPGTLTPEEAVFFNELRFALQGLSGPAFMQAFVTRQVRPGVPLPPPPQPPPPWMATRPAGIAAMMAAFGAHPFDRATLRTVACPVFIGYGDQTSEQEAVRAGVLSRLFPDISVRRFPGVHHFSPAEAIYDTEHVDALRRLWGRATF